MDSPKRIAILINTSWNIYNFRKNLILNFLNLGFQVHAIAPKDEFSKKLVNIGCIFHELEIDPKSKNPFKDILLLYRIKKHLHLIQPDILLNYTIKPNIYGSLAARWLRIPCINNISGLGTLYSGDKVSKIMFNFLIKISQKHVQTIFFQNPDDLMELTKNKIVRHSVARLLPGSGVNLLDFPYSPPKEKKKIIFLLVARMLYSKGIIEFVEAATNLRNRNYFNFEVRLLGELGVSNPQAIPKKVLDRYINDDYIFYLGKTNDVVPIIQESDVIVLPSYREGTPKSLLEGMSIGRPVIATNVPGCRETVMDGINGYLCKVKSVVDLEDKMVKFLNLSHQERLAMGIQSRKISETKFDDKIVIKQYNEVIKLVLN